MYISILNYETGKVIIHKVEDTVDAEDYVSENYGLSNTYYMTTAELELEVLTNEDI
jgi:hypothetical protein